MRQNSRRAFLGSIASMTLAGTAAAGGSVSTNDSGVSAAAASVDERVSRLLDELRVEEAIQLLEKHDVDYHAFHESRPLRSESDGVDSSDYYSKGQSDVYFGAYHRYDNTYQAYLTWYLDPDGSNLVDDSYPKDAAVIGWEDSVWSPDPDSVSTSSNFEQPSGREDGASLCSVENEPILDAPANAIGVTFDDMLYWGYSAKKISGGLTIDLTKENTGTEGVIIGEYNHTWNLLGTAWLNPFGGLSITVPGSGGSVSISLNLPSGADNWELPSDLSDKTAKL